MNKKELIGKINSIPWDEGKVVDTLKINRAGLIQLIEQFDEPKEKVVLPRSVANWISCVRGRNKNIHFALENAPEEVNLWFCEDEKNRQNIFADAWVNGYHIEKEKRYYVKLKAVDQYLVRNEDENFLGFLQSRLKSKFTRKQLEQAELGWVFDCPGIEIEEVEE